MKTSSILRKQTAPTMNVLRLASAVALAETITIGAVVFEATYGQSVTAGNIAVTLSSAATAAAATTTLTSNNTNVSDGATVTIGSKVYRFKDTLAAINDVKIGADADTSLLNLIKAINGTGTEGTHYYTGTVAHTLVTAAASVTSHAFAITAIYKGTAGNSIASTETSATLSFTGATLASGADATGEEFLDLFLVVLHANQAVVRGTKIGAAELLLVRSNGKPESFACTETLAGSNNAFAAATSFGGNVADEETPNLILSRVPTAVEVALGNMHFPLGFTPTQGIAAVRVTSTGVAKAWDGGLTFAAGRVTLTNAGSTDWAATDTVTIVPG